MMVYKTIAGLAVAGLLSACNGIEGYEGQGPIARSGIGPDKSIDRGVDSHHLSTMVAGIWVDPNGCDHWIIDDGVEGYLSERLQPDGTPVCSGVAPPNVVVGPFQEGTPVPDSL